MSDAPRHSPLCKMHRSNLKTTNATPQKCLKDQGIDPQEVAALLTLQLRAAFADGDTKAMVQITKEMDRVRRWSAHCQTTADPLQQVPAYSYNN